MRQHLNGIRQDKLIQNTNTATVIKINTIPMKKIYEPPMLTIIPIHVEHGYASSMAPELNMVVSDFHGTTTEERNISNNWTSDNDEGFWSNSY
jgi:hypothetical protein